MERQQELNLVRQQHDWIKSFLLTGVTAEAIAGTLSLDIEKVLKIEAKIAAKGNI